MCQPCNNLRLDVHRITSTGGRNNSSGSSSSRGSVMVAAQGQVANAVAMAVLEAMNGGSRFPNNLSKGHRTDNSRSTANNKSNNKCTSGSSSSNQRARHGHNGDIVPLPLPRRALILRQGKGLVKATINLERKPNYPSSPWQPMQRPQTKKGSQAVVVVKNGCFKERK